MKKNLMQEIIERAEQEILETECEKINVIKKEINKIFEGQNINTCLASLVTLLIDCFDQLEYTDKQIDNFISNLKYLIKIKEKLENNESYNN